MSKEWLHFMLLFHTIQQYFQFTVAVESHNQGKNHIFCPILPDTACKSGLKFDLSEFLSTWIFCLQTVFCVFSRD